MPAKHFGSKRYYQPVAETMFFTTPLKLLITDSIVYQVRRLFGNAERWKKWTDYHIQWCENPQTMIDYNAGKLIRGTYQKPSPNKCPVCMLEEANKRVKEKDSGAAVTDTVQVG